MHSSCMQHADSCTTSRGCSSTCTCTCTCTCTTTATAPCHCCWWGCNGWIRSHGNSSRAQARQSRSRSGSSSLSSCASTLCAHTVFETLQALACVLVSNLADHGAVGQPLDGISLHLGTTTANWWRALSNQRACPNTALPRVVGCGVETDTLKSTHHQFAHTPQAHGTQQYTHTATHTVTHTATHSHRAGSLSHTATTYKLSHLHRNCHTPLTTVR